MKVKMTKLIDRYERELVSKVTGKYKRAYIGEIGEVIRMTRFPDNNYMYDVKFEDGQVWCLNSSQFVEVDK